MIITGASGMLGRALTRQLAAYNPIGTAWTRLHNGLVKLNLLDDEAVTEFLYRHRPKIIIHAAAERRPDISEKEPEQTAALNVGATRTIAQIARELDAFVLYLSTDYVFDGTKPPYKPGDTTNPLNLYGQTKLAGERALFAELPGAAVLRIGVLFGQVETPGESAVTALVDLIRAGQPKAVDDWAKRYPAYTDDVARLIQQIIDRHLSGIAMNGLWHWCGDEEYSKYAQAVLIGKILGHSTTHLSPDPRPAAGAPRPHDCKLDCTALESLGLGQHTKFERALTQSLQASGIT